MIFWIFLLAKQLCPVHPYFGKNNKTYILLAVFSLVLSFISLKLLGTKVAHLKKENPVHSNSYSGLACLNSFITYCLVITLNIIVLVYCYYHKTNRFYNEFEGKWSTALICMIGSDWIAIVIHVVYGLTMPGQIIACLRCAPFQHLFNQSNFFCN